ncbi:hypothetical protein [Pseudomonas paracarnis]|uniref:hypothetical protein n=1 Tax=Pseudomonas paracarnis TaxID=2750625 RepID=UPI00249AB2F8|nr:hypothetical protein [Pseudomonas paracarnis]MDI3184648.1 hypothetical protein [Pseudomonas paracarnis]
MTLNLIDGQRVVYQTDENGFYVGEATAYPDPKNPGSWLIPAGCVEIKPPHFIGKARPQWVDYKWKFKTT